MTDKIYGSFIWDTEKESINIHKHGINFSTAAQIFNDPHRKIYIDSKHSETEPRYFCIGKIKGKIVTVRFTYRANKIRIFGSGHWRKGVYYYEKR